MSMKIISRGKGQSAIASAAYRAGEKITNEQTGIVHDYTKKQGVAKSVIILPENVPEEFYNRSTLWNAVERVEKASNSQLAREIEIALPKELSYPHKQSLAFEYVKKNFTSKGMIADMNFHNLDSDNPHVHIMLTMRPFNEDGTWGDKQRKVYHLDENGDKIYDPVKRQYKCSKEQTTDWNERHKAEEWRASWADMCNAELEKKGYDDRIDHRSFERQGITQIPTIHLGTACHQMEQRGIRTERGDINRAIKLANAEIENINATLRKLEAELEQLKADELREIQQQQQKSQQQEIPPATTPKSPSPVLIKNEVKTDIPKTPKPTTTKTEVVKNTNVKANTAPAPKPKPKSITTQNHVPKPKANQTPVQKPATKPKPKPRTLKQVDLELDIVETKLSRLNHADTVLTLYDHKIQDMERNLHTVGFFERRKMNKEIAEQEKKRSDFQKETTKNYGTRPQLERAKDNLLAEKRRIENATGITAMREAEQQRKRDEVIRQRESRDRYNAERKSKRLTNPNRGKDEAEI